MNNLEIKKAKTLGEKEECFQFFKKMWKEEFNIDFDKNLDNKRDGFYNTKIFYIKYEGTVVSSISFLKLSKGSLLVNGEKILNDTYSLDRLGTLKEHRKNGYSSKLIIDGIKEISKEGLNEVYISAELSNIDYYSKFGFVDIGGKTCEIDGNKFIYMKKDILEDN